MYNTANFHITADIMIAIERWHAPRALRSPKIMLTKKDEV